MFDQISIIGCGLIGSSIFKSLKKAGSVKKIITYDNDKSVNEVIKKNNLSDEIFNNVYSLVQYGWKKEAIPIVQEKKSIIARFFELFFK